MRNKLLCLFIISATCFSGFADTRSMQVYVNSQDIEQQGLYAEYIGSTLVGTTLNVSKFKVCPTYSVGDTITHGDLLKETEYTINTDVLQLGDNVITVTASSGLSTTITVTGSEAGSIFVEAQGLNIVATEAAVKQVEDDSVLSSGKDIIYKVESVTDSLKTESNIEKPAVIELYTDASTNNYKVSTIDIYDISVQRIVDQEVTQEVTQLNSTIQICMDIPSNYLKDTRDYFFMHEHNGVIEKLEDEDNEPSTITVTTSKFSDYVLAYREPDVSCTSEQSNFVTAYTGPATIGHTVTSADFDAVFFEHKYWSDNSVTDRECAVPAENITVERTVLADGVNTIHYSIDYSGYQAADVLNVTCKAVTTTTTDSSSHHKSSHSSSSSAKNSDTVTRSDVDTAKVMKDYQDAVNDYLRQVAESQSNQVVTTEYSVNDKPVKVTTPTVVTHTESSQEQSTGTESTPSETDIQEPDEQLLASTNDTGTYIKDGEMTKVTEVPRTTSEDNKDKTSSMSIMLFSILSFLFAVASSIAIKNLITLSKHNVEV